MSIFDQFFFVVFETFKPRFKQKANNWALAYVSWLQISLLFLIGCFFTAFFSKMHLQTMSQEKAWILFVLGSIALHLKNWINYSGQTRKVLNAKRNKNKSPQYSMLLLAALPVLAIIFGILFLQAL